MGLTGSILSLSINLKKIDSSYVIVKNTRFENFDNLISEMSTHNADFPYSVAWLDLSGKFEGRGILTQGRHAHFDESPQKRNAPQRSSTFVRKALKPTMYPALYPAFLTNARSIKVFNSFWFQKPLKQGVQDIHTFMHPLDGLPNWNLLYGKKGLIQYQFVVPYNEVKFIKLLMTELRKINANSLVGVLKNFGIQSAGHLSFPQLGWTFSVDLPAGIENLSATLDRLDEKLVEAGGRIYLTKDSRMNSKHLELMYPRIHDWRRIRDELDPHKIWKSDQSRRLKIC
jgi:decaprenylphospho-beta-D-ribofuranose 2-oxidase